MRQRNDLASCLIALLLLISTAGLRAQTASPATSPTTPSQYEKEKQLPLDVDRDPIPTPDAATDAVGEALARDKGGFLLRKDVDEVVLNATVVDDKGHLVTTLDESSFKVYEDGVQQKLIAFRREDIPVSLGILVDDSGSMQDKRRAVATAALDFVRLSNPQDETFIVNFADEAFLDQDFTADIKKLNDALGHIDSRGGTALYDAISASADNMTKTARRARQVLLIITDGQDNASSSSLEDTIRRVQDLQGPVIYAVGLLFGDESRGEARAAKRVLTELAQQTGGVAYFPKALEQMDEVCGQVARDIRNQYILGYKSTKPAELGGYRAVKVEVKANGYGRLSARTRSGYYPKSGQQKAPVASGGQ